MQQGKFIVIEGSDGAGKGTIVAHLRKTFGETGFVYTREPGGTAVSEKIRSLILENPMDSRTELLLFFAARQENLAKVIWPALREGKNVVCDRFSASTFAYQVAGQKRSRDLFDAMDQNVVGPLRDAVHHIYIDVPVEITMQRIGSRGEALTKFETEDFQRTVREGYHEYFRHCHDVIIIDGTEPATVVVRRVEEKVRAILAMK